MAYSITKNPDGDVNLGNRQGEEVTLQPAVSDYATGGYAVVDGEQYNANSSLTINCDLWRVIGVVPIGNQSGYELDWNTTSKKVEVYKGGTQVSAGTDLSAFAFQLLLYGQ